MNPVRWRISGGSLWAGKRKRAVRRTACSLNRWPVILGEEFIRLREDHWWVEGSAHGWRMASTGSRENAAAIGVSLWIGRAAQGPRPPVCGGAGAGCNDRPRINLLPGGRCTPGALQPDQRTQIINEPRILHFTRDMIRLVAALSGDAGYTGSWLLGVQLDHLYGARTRFTDAFEDSGTYQDHEYSSGLRVTSRQIHQQTEILADQLLRTLLRGFGTEFLLIQPPFPQSE